MVIKVIKDDLKCTWTYNPRITLIGTRCKKQVYIKLPMGLVNDIQYCCFCGKILTHIQAVK